ncbi:MAG: glycosyltransferase family 2 protein [Solirubrobacteraceae bacterium]
MTRLSIVIPFLDEVESLPLLFAALQPVLNAVSGDNEVILVDDGSTDGGLELVRRFCLLDERFRVVSFSRNFGHQTAITAGMDLARGEAIVVMDADLQHPPNTIFDLIGQWEAGNDVVYAIRRGVEAETKFKRLSARLYYRLLDRLTEIEVPLNAADFRLLDRRVVAALSEMREGDRYLRGMIAWLGFAQTEVHYSQPGRAVGHSKYTLRRMIRLATDGVVGFSNLPLHLAINVGFVFSALALVSGLFTIGQRLLGADLVPGWASVLVLVAFIGGVQLLVLGVLGVYLGRTYGESKRRPLYVVRELINLESADVTPSRAVLPRAVARREE